MAATPLRGDASPPLKVLGSPSMLDVVFKKLATFDVVADHEREVLAQAMGHPKLVPAGQDLVSQGDRPNGSTALLDGWAGRYKILADGQRQLTAIHIPGDFVDLHAFLMRRLDHGITALTDCRVVLAQHDKLTTISETEPHLTRLLWLSTLVDGAINREWLAVMGGLSARHHAAHLLCEIYTRLAAVGLVEGGSFRFPITQSAFGEALGVSSVHTNRAIQELRAQGLIVWESGTVTILDWKGLMDFGEFDPSYLQQTVEPR